MKKSIFCMLLAGVILATSACGLFSGNVGTYSDETMDYDTAEKTADVFMKVTGKDKLDMWELLGVDLKDAETGQMRDKMDIMWDLGETLLSISKLQEEGRTNLDAEALSMEVFGKSYL